MDEWYICNDASKAELREDKFSRLKNERDDTNKAKKICYFIFSTFFLKIFLIKLFFSVFYMQ